MKMNVFLILLSIFLVSCGGTKPKDPVKDPLESGTTPQGGGNRQGTPGTGTGGGHGGTGGTGGGNGDGGGGGGGIPIAVILGANTLGSSSVGSNWKLDIQAYAIREGIDPSQVKDLDILEKDLEIIAEKKDVSGLKKIQMASLDGDFKINYAELEINGTKILSILPSAYDQTAFNKKYPSQVEATNAFINGVKTKYAINSSSIRYFKAADLLISVDTAPDSNKNIFISPPTEDMESSSTGGMKLFTDLASALSQDALLSNKESAEVKISLAQPVIKMSGNTPSLDFKVALPKKIMQTMIPDVISKNSLSALAQNHTNIQCDGETLDGLYLHVATFVVNDKNDRNTYVAISSQHSFAKIHGNIMLLGDASQECLDNIKILYFTYLKSPTNDHSGPGSVGDRQDWIIFNDNNSTSFNNALFALIHGDKVKPFISGNKANRLKVIGINKPSDIPSSETPKNKITNFYRDEMVQVMSALDTLESHGDYDALKGSQFVDTQSLSREGGDATFYHAQAVADFIGGNPNAKINAEGGLEWKDGKPEFKLTIKNGDIKEGNPVPYNLTYVTKQLTLELKDPKIVTPSAIPSYFLVSKISFKYAEVAICGKCIVNDGNKSHILGTPLILEMDLFNADGEVFSSNEMIPGSLNPMLKSLSLEELTKVADPL